MKALLYCPNSKPYLVYGCTNKYTMSYGYDTTYSEEIKNNLDCFNGKIIGECDYEVEEIKLIETPEYAGSECNTFLYDVSINFETKTLNEDDLCKQSCLTADKLDKYLDLYNEKEVYGYAIHIKNLDIWNTPRSLERMDVKSPIKNITKALALRIAGFTLERYIIIPVRPELMCKILNGDCTVIVKKKVLKEMI